MYYQYMVQYMYIRLRGDPSECPMHVLSLYGTIHVYEVKRGSIKFLTFGANEEQFFLH
jgi:hypothetical protein